MVAFERQRTPRTGDEFDWEVEAATIRQAEQKAQDAGMLISRIEPISQSPQPEAKSEVSETTLFTAHPAMVRNHPVGFVLAVVLCLVGIGFLILLFWWLHCLGTAITVTNERTILRRGILSKATNEVWHRDIRNVQISQGFLQRLLDVGAIGISSAGQSGIEIAVSGVPSPYKVKELLDQHKRQTSVSA